MVFDFPNTDNALRREAGTATKAVDCPAMGSLLIGLTGGIGTGKSRVADVLRGLGAAVECSDRIVRELQARGGEALAQIVEQFGAEFLTAEGELDREKMGALVFREPEARLRLGQIIHPLVYRTLTERSAGHRAAGIPVIVQDIPLLLEGRLAGTGSGAKTPFDVIAVVYASEEQQLRRIMDRDDLTREAAIARIGAQVPIEKKRELADVVIDNTGEWHRTVEQVHALFEDWEREAARR